MNLYTIGLLGVEKVTASWANQHCAKTDVEHYPIDQIVGLRAGNILPVPLDVWKDHLERQGHGRRSACFREQNEEEEDTSSMDCETSSEDPRAGSGLDPAGRHCWYKNRGRKVHQWAEDILPRLGIEVQRFGMELDKCC